MPLRSFNKPKLIFLYSFFFAFVALWSTRVCFAQLPAPTVTASALNGAVSLQWAPLPGAIDYFVYRTLILDTPTGTLTPTDTPTATPTGTLSPPPSPIATVAQGTTLIYQDFQVINGENYLYQVAGFDNNGLGLPTSIMASPFAYPAAVQPVTLQNLHSNALDLSWGVPYSSFPISFYQIYRYGILIPTPAPSSTFTFTITFTPTDTIPAGINTYTPVPTLTFTPTFTFTPSPTLPVGSVPVSIVLTATTPIGTAVGTTFTDTSAVSLLTDGFYYVVLAVDSQPTPAIGLAPTVSTNAALPQNLAPVAPNLSVFLLATVTPIPAYGSYGYRLLWNGAVSSEGVTGYQVLVNSIPVTTIVVVPTPLPTYSYDDQTIPFSTSTGVTTNYQVVAISANGPATSNTFVGNIYKSQLLGPVSVQPNPTADATQGVTIGWSQGIGGTYGLNGYRVYKSQYGLPPMTPSITPALVTNVVIAPSSTPTLVVVDTGAPNAQGLSYWVEPYDALGLGGTIGVPPTPSLNLAPTPVASVSAVSVTGANNEFTVSWTAGGPGFYGPVQNDVIYRELSANPTLTPIATVSAAQNNYNDFVVGTSGTTVLYQIAAVDSKGNKSDFSSSTPVVLSGQVTPGPPQVLPVSSNAAALQFSWKANPASDGVTNYNVFGSDFLTLTATTTLTPTPIAYVTAIPTATVYSILATATPWTASFYYLEAQNSGSSAPATLSGIPVETYQVTAVMTPSSTRQIFVSWNMVPTTTPTPFIGNYGVYRSLTPGANFTPIATVGIGTSSYVDKALSPGTMYYYRTTVRADMAATNLLPESPLYPSMMPIPEASVNTWPSVPVLLTPAAGASAITFSWAANVPQESVTNYSIQSNQNGIPVPTINIPVTVGGTPTCVANLPEIPGNVYSYQIVAENAQGPSDASQAITILVPPSMTPTILVTPQPAYIQTPNAIPSYTPLVSISGMVYPPSGSVSGFTIYRSAVLGTPTFIPITTVTSPTTIVSDPNPTAGVTNYYSVVANNGAGVSTSISLSGFTGIGLWPDPPQLTLTSSNTAVTLSWATPVGDNTSITSFTVYRSIYPSVTPTIITTVTYPNPGYSDSGVTTGQGYYYWVDAQGPGGNSVLPPSQTIIAMQPPTLAITPLSGRNVLSWSPVTVSTPTFATGYVVNRAFPPTPGMTPSFFQDGSVLQGLSTTTFVDSGVTETGSYLYQVAAVNLSNPSLRSVYSNTVTQTVQAQPVSMLIAVSGDQVAQLRWNNQGVTTITYTIQRKLGTAPDSSYQTIKTGVQGVNYLDTGLQDKTFYSYRIITVDIPFGGVTYISAPSAPAIALPAKPPVVLNATVNLAQNSDSAQTLIGNTLSWVGADQGGIDPTTMYPLGGYVIYRSKDGGGIYDTSDFPPAIIPVTLVNGMPSSPVVYFDQTQLVNGPTYTYLVQAFDSPPDLPVPLSQAVTQGLVHTTPYNIVTAYPVSSNTALDRNAIRPFSALPNEKVVNIRFVVTSQGNVNIKVYSLNGTFVRELVNTSYPPGIHWTSWDAKNMNGNLVATGVYLISTESPGGHQEFQKVAVIK